MRHFDQLPTHELQKQISFDLWSAREEDHHLRNVTGKFLLTSYFEHRFELELTKSPSSDDYQIDQPWQLMIALAYGSNHGPGYRSPTTPIWSQGIQYPLPSEEGFLTSRVLFEMKYKQDLEFKRKLFSYFWSNRHAFSILDLLSGYNPKQEKNSLHWETIWKAVGVSKQVGRSKLNRDFQRYFAGEAIEAEENSLGLPNLPASLLELEKWLWENKDVFFQHKGIQVLSPIRHYSFKSLLPKVERTFSTLKTQPDSLEFLIYKIVLSQKPELLRSVWRNQILGLSEQTMSGGLTIPSLNRLLQTTENALWGASIAYEDLDSKGLKFVDLIGMILNDWTWVSLEKRRAFILEILYDKKSNLYRHDWNSKEWRDSRDSEQVFELLIREGTIEHLGRFIIDLENSKTDNQDENRIFYLDYTRILEKLDAILFSEHQKKLGDQHSCESQEGFIHYLGELYYPALIHHLKEEDEGKFPKTSNSIEKTMQKINPICLKSFSEETLKKAFRIQSFYKSSSITDSFMKILMSQLSTSKKNRKWFLAQTEEKRLFSQQFAIDVFSHASSDKMRTLRESTEKASFKPLLTDYLVALKTYIPASFSRDMFLEELSLQLGIEGESLYYQIEDRKTTNPKTIEAMKESAEQLLISSAFKRMDTNLKLDLLEFYLKKSNSSISEEYLRVKIEKPLAEALREFVFVQTGFSPNRSVENVTAFKKMILFMPDSYGQADIQFRIQMLLDAEDTVTGQLAHKHILRKRMDDLIKGTVYTEAWNILKAIDFEDKEESLALSHFFSFVSLGETFILVYFAEISTYLAAEPDLSSVLEIEENSVERKSMSQSILRSFSKADIEAALSHSKKPLNLQSISSFNKVYLELELSNTQERLKAIFIPNKRNIFYQDRWIRASCEIDSPLAKVACRAFDKVRKDSSCDEFIEKNHFSRWIDRLFKKQTKELKTKIGTFCF